MKSLILIKFGGSVITDKSKPFTARPKVIARLIREIKKKFKGKDSDVIIGHGGGSFPHVFAAKYQTHKGLIIKSSIWGMTLTADAAIEINRIVIKEFVRQKVPAVSFAPLSFIYEGKTFVDHIQKALEIGLVPVVYGDVIMDSKKGFHINSGEAILDLLASKLAKRYKKIKVIYYSDTFGVYDDQGKTIPVISLESYKKIERFLTGSKNTDVTGGMLSKVKESLELVSKYDAEVYIMNGLSRGKFTVIRRK